MTSSVRRKLLFTGVAAAAGLAGAGLAWWKLQPGEMAPDAAAGLWPLTFPTPAGQALAMQSLRGKPLLLNFWATWCPPCVEELPLLEGFYRQHAPNNWQVLGLAVDQLAPVQQFLKKMPLSFPIALAGLGGTELGKSLGNLSGGLPFTVVLGADGVVRHRRMGRVTQADLQQWAGLG